MRILIDICLQSHDDTHACMYIQSHTDTHMHCCAYAKYMKRTHTCAQIHINICICMGM